MYHDISGITNSSFPYYKGISRVSGGNSRGVLPPQAIPLRKKTKAWEKACMDSLEREGIKQYVENLSMKDYYDMLNGDMVYCDVIGEEVDTLYRLVNKTKEELNIPHYVRHHDLMYPVVQKFVGDWLMNAVKLRFDSIDDVSTNEFIQERTFRLSEYTKAVFQQQLDKLMVMSGYDITRKFETEQEQQQYEQQRQAILEEFMPDRIDNDMRFNWKTDFAMWAEKTYMRDYFRFNMSYLYMKEAIDILLVGKSARHYRVGYDYYTPEYWHPIETFHSKESSVHRLEDCEFVGRVKYYTLSELINTYGDRISEKDRINIYKGYYGENYTQFVSLESDYSGSKFLNESHFNRMRVPFRGYNDHLMALEIEEATGIPLSEETDLVTGETKPTFSLPINNTNLSNGPQLFTNLRTDFDVRTDTIQTTEAYWRGSKKIGVLTYRAATGYLTTVEVDESILPEVLEEYNIKNLRSKTLAEYDLLKDDEKENTILWVDVPITYRGVKVNLSGLSNVEDIYLVEEMDFNIKGEKGNLFDIKLPVCGTLTDSFCKKIRGEQIEYNYLLNQNQGYREREIGAMFLFDVNGVPDDLVDLGEGTDKIVSLFNIAKSTGMLPVDMSRNNLNQNGGGLPFNPNGVVNVSFTNEILRNEEMAQRVKWRAYEKLGLSPQSLGVTQQYSTVEGIQVGQRATLAQTYSLEKLFLDNYSINAEIHISVAQYCQRNKKDANYIYLASDSELGFLNSIKDDDFSIRQVGVRPIMDPAKLREFRELKQQLMAMNTVGGDHKTFTELFLADETLELREAVDRAREFMVKNAEAQREHEEKMKQMELEQNDKHFAEEIKIKQGRNEATVESAYLRSLGQAASRSDDNDGLEIIEREYEQKQKDKNHAHKRNLEYDKLVSDINRAKENLKLKYEELALKNRALDIKEQEIASRNKASDTKEFTSIINKN